MTKACTFAVGVAIMGGVLFCLSTSSHADGKWWRSSPTADLDLPEALKACAALPANSEGVDRIGCAITAILAGRTALARDDFLLVTDADARSCVKQTSASAKNAQPALTLMVAYCKTKVGSFSDSRRLLGALKAPAGNSDAADTALRFEAFRTAVLAHAVNGEGEAEKAINLIRQHPQFPSSDILRAELFEIYVEDERHGELTAWWESLKSSTFSDSSLRALCEAQIALIRGAPDEARHVLEAVAAAPPQDGAKTLEVARYRIAQRSSGANSASGRDKGRMDMTTIVTPGSQMSQSTSALGIGLGPFSVNARGVNFNIDRNKLNRPGVALPIGFFY